MAILLIIFPPMFKETTYHSLEEINKNVIER